MPAFVNPDAPPVDPSPTPQPPGPPITPIPGGNPTPTPGGSGTPGGPGPAPPYNPTPGDFALLRTLLDRYGLGSLYNQAVQWMVSGFDENQVNLALRETPEFRTRFAGIFTREQNGFPPISVDEYLAYEDMAFQTMRELGYPPGFYDDPSDFATAIGQNVSLNEFRQRAEVYADLAVVGRDEIRRQLATHMGPEAAEALDGLTDTELAAWTMDPQRALPALRQRLQAAQVSAAAVQSGFGSLSYAESTALTARGIEEAAARQAFAALAQQGDVTGTLAGEDAGSGMGRAGQLGVVEGDAAALTELERRRRGRQGAFQGGGGFATSDEGVSGLGRA
jgi:hypothetical protein